MGTQDHVGDVSAHVFGVRHAYLQRRKNAAMQAWFDAYFGAPSYTVVAEKIEKANSAYYNTILSGRGVLGEWSSPLSRGSIWI